MSNQTKTRLLPAREQGREPTSEDQEPPMYEHGVNTPASQEDGSSFPEDIADALEVEEIDVDLYRSKSLWRPARARGVFGGQVIAQGTAAANKTVRQGVFLHCYFLLAGDQTVPILYQVERVRDGGSYVTRSVKATQRGKSIFTIILSYQRPEPNQPRFQIPVPTLDSSGSTMTASSAKDRIKNLPGPEESPLNEARYEKVLDREPNLDPKLRSILQSWVNDRKKSPVEIRDALPGMYDSKGMPTPGDQQAFWLRTRKPVQGGIEAQKVALAYASDFYLLSTVTKALENSRTIKMMASLDHSMWFYDSFDVNDWLLFVMQTQGASNGRGVAMGRIYRKDGTLVAVVAQEGMVRGKEAKSSKI
ncbi:putative peroxisomal acyl-coenzyme A thioester hydrolase 1 [Violaceomyces palustris]|uniref:Peroxisomal acyl-coenzyme A thioester hydrolase 1 n=1 Tax=Violaceomyces palustris TaxID=1673888 RepID=A0ACD0NQ93_9BASI|nr:putative peroxisomal acyl-coenzyme A thioester hydrolase 1 [Violaceomyces palustris]